MKENFPAICQQLHVTIRRFSAVYITEVTMVIY